MNRQSTLSRRKINHMVVAIASVTALNDHFLEVRQCAASALGELR